MRDKKKKKEGAQIKGGENSPISPPLDPRLDCQPFLRLALLWPREGETNSSCISSFFFVGVGMPYFVAFFFSSFFLGGGRKKKDSNG